MRTWSLREHRCDSAKYIPNLGKLIESVMYTEQVEASCKVLTNPTTSTA